MPKRASILFKYHQLLSDNHEELAKMIVMENGKASKKHTVRYIVGLNVWNLLQVLQH